MRALLEIRNIQSARQRIHAWLRFNANENREIVLQTTYKDMAYQLGLAHETLYRALKYLEQDGILVKKDNVVRLC